jgi:hypothetical protein
MNKTRFLGLLVIIMVVLNLIMVSLFFLGKPSNGPHNRPGEIKKVISERLNFSESQNQAYEELIVGHRDSIRQLDEEMMIARNGLYSQLSKNDQVAVDSQLVVIGRLQQQIESVHFNHFADIRELCNEQQVGEFNKMTDDLASYFGVPKPTKRKH